MHVERMSLRKIIRDNSICRQPGLVIRNQNVLVKPMCQSYIAEKGVKCEDCPIEQGVWSDYVGERFKGFLTIYQECITW